LFDAKKNQKTKKDENPPILFLTKKTKTESICNKLPNALKSDRSVTCVLAPRFA